MTRADWVILCIAYLGGLLSTNLMASKTSEVTPDQLGLLVAGLVCLGTVAKIAFTRQIKTTTVILAVVVALMAVWYLQFRLPRPQANDVSYQVQPESRELVTLSGEVLTEPRLNDRQRLRFWLQAQELKEGSQVSGKVYVTLPLLQGTGIYPGTEVSITGVLYLPQGSSNPGGFNFQEYLARQGIFSGMQGMTVTSKETEPGWGWWQLRRRIVRSQLKGLGSPLGQLVSSMVLGRKAVDLPGDIRDRFINAGLAHVLAASGFHVSLLLGIMLRLTGGFNGKTKLIVGTVTLLVYLGLTGIQASVLRACLMGFAVLLALATETKVKPLGSLLVTATIILLWNPLLIQDLGFQLSFLATLGLIVTLPALQQQLEWLPPTIATLVAVPLAASVWVLPLLCFVFHSFATYSILVNIVATPLITMISLGGMVSAIAALIVPAAGSAIAGLLFYPVLLLTKLTQLVTNLPGSSWAVGQIPLGFLLLIYGALILVWLNRWCRQYWGYIFLAVVGLILLPTIINLNQVRVTILAAQQAPIIVLQDRGQTILINSGKGNQAKYTILPFLRRQGINHIDYGLALDRHSNSEAEWQEIARNIKLKRLAASKSIDNQILASIQTANQPIATSSASLSLNQSLAVINLQIKDTTWLIISPTTEGRNNYSQQDIQQYIQEHQLQHPILVWSGNKLDSAWLELIQPQKAIAAINKIEQSTQQQLRQRQIELHNTTQSGSISWTPQTGFITQTEQRLY